MKRLTLFLLITFTLSACQPTSVMPTDTAGETLRSDPPGQIIADLEAYIPGRMAQGNIPGLTIALIQDHQVAWTEGFGVTNRFSNTPMPPDAVFEVASLSKVVAAYTAMHMVSDGQLSLDEPVYSYLPSSWNPGTPYDNEVTLRDLLSHSAGIFNQGEATPPGESFYYTGYGYARVQRVMQSKSGRNLEDLAQEYTLDPLGMNSTSYISPADLQPRLVNGHVQSSYPVSRFLAITAVFFIATLTVLVVFLRIWKKKWLFTTPVIWILAAVAATSAALIGLWYVYHWYVPKMGRLMAIAGLSFEALLAVLLFIGFKFRKRLPPIWQTSPRKPVAFTAYILLSMAVLIGFSSLITIPTPQKPARFPSAAGSMWASAPDLAKLMIELSDSQHLPPDIATEMTSPQIAVNPNLAWGLGIGIQRSDQGISLWHTGVHFDFNTLVVIYPESGNGVVILTNTNADQAALRDIAQLALGGKADWEIPRDVQSSSIMPQGGTE